MTRLGPSVLVCGLAVAMLSCKPEGSPNVFVDPALAALVPADSTFVAGVRLQKLKHEGFAKEFIDSDRLPVLRELRSRFGIDLRKDIWELIIPGNSESAVLLLRGRFSDMGREPRVVVPGGVRSGYKGYTFLGDNVSAVTFLNPTTAIAGRPEVLRKVIDGRNDVNGVPPDLLRQIKAISSANQIWFTGDVRALAPLLAKESLLGGTRVTAAADLRNGFVAQFALTTGSESEALRLEQEWNYFAGAKGASVTRNGLLVEGRFKLSLEEVKERPSLWDWTLLTASEAESRRRD